MDPLSTTLVTPGNGRSIRLICVKGLLSTQVILLICVCILGVTNSIEKNTLEAILNIYVGAVVGTGAAVVVQKTNDKENSS